MVSARAARSAYWEGRELRDPLRGGTLFSAEGEWGVLYNKGGPRLPKMAALRSENVSLSILTRNRRDDVLHLIDSIERTFPHRGAPRLVHVNNSSDGTQEAIAKFFPHWRVLVYENSQYKEPSQGILWIRRNAPYLLSGAEDAYGVASGYVASNSIAWLRNQTILACPTPWLMSFDDDCEVLPGWFSYYEAMQHATDAPAVINNWAFLALHKSVIRRVGWYDERYVSNHGYEDTDYALRLNRLSVPWVLGFNADHDWRTAEEGNPRGSMTGNDRFIHRSAVLRQGFSARLQTRERDRVPFSNADWHRVKWLETSDRRRGVIDRPPFKGKYFQCRVPGEPQWHPLADLTVGPRQIPSSEPARHSRLPARAPRPIARKLQAATVILTNRDTLPYLQLALGSIRRHFSVSDHELLVFDDASGPRDVEWLIEHQKEYGYELYLQRGEDRVGIVHAYDFAVKVARREVVFVVHSDMYFAPNADAELLRRLEPGLVLSATRVEPPIHRGQERAKVLRDFGREADGFDEPGFLGFAEEFSHQNSERTTTGLFAPFLLFRDDYCRLGGHDPAFAPQSLEDSDFFNRMVLAGYKTMQCWSSLCYHFTSRGSRFRDGLGRDSTEWTASHWKNRRNFARKWGRTEPSVDEFCTPAVLKKYKIGLDLQIPEEFSAEEFLRVLVQVEPLVTQINFEAAQKESKAREIAQRYVEEESKRTPLLKASKMTYGNRGSLEGCDVLVRSTLEQLSSDGLHRLVTLPSRLDQLREPGSLIHGGLRVEVKDLRCHHERENLILSPPENFNPELPPHARIDYLPRKR